MLVGRDEQLARLRTALESSLQGRGRLALISGDAGIGKTALAEEISAAASAAGALAVWGRCLEGEGAPPYWPWTQVLQALPGWNERPSINATQEGRFQFFEWAFEALRRAASAGGLLIVIDDLHWADEPSLVFLRFLAGGLDSIPVMVVANYRGGDLRPAEPISRALPELLRERSAGHMTLTGLTRPQVAEVIELVTDDAPAAATANRVFERTEGNPFFVIEMIRLLAGGANVDQLPEGVRQTIRRRIEPLPEACRELLRESSVVGREFDLGLLAQLTGRPARDLLQVLDPALSARLVVEVADSAGRLRFNHALIRETLYEDLAASRRVELHHRVALALEPRLAQRPDAYLTEVATHFFRAAPGGDALKAVDYATRAGDDAVRRCAFEEAARLYRMALGALPHEQADDRKRAGTLLSLARALDLSDQQVAALDASVELARIAARLNAPELAAEAALVSEGSFTLPPDADRMEAICEQALAALDDSQPALRARVLAQLAVTLTFKADVRREGLAREALELAETTGDPPALAAALSAIQLIPWGKQDPQSRLRAGDRLLELGLETSNRKTELSGHYWRMAAFFEMGDMARLDAEIDRYGQVADEIKDPSARWRTALSRGARAQMTGLFADAERHAAEVKASALPTQNRTVQVMQSALIAAIRRAQGRNEEAIAAMDAALRLGVNQTLLAIRACALAALGRVDEARIAFNRIAAPDLRSMARPHTWAITMIHLAEIAAMLRDKHLAEVLYELLLPYPHLNAVAAANTAAGYGSIARYLGLLALTMDRPDEAIAHHEAGIAMNQRQGALPYLAFGECELAEALIRRGRTADRARAATLLAKSLERAMHLGMSQLAARAAASMAELRPADDRAPLSPREAEVAALVAEGLTNRQIGDRLHVSTRTAENHVENICNKLGFTSRAQVAAWAVEKGLRRSETEASQGPKKFR